MKCQEFQDNLAEYVAGHLPTLQNDQMLFHAQSCVKCAGEEAGERDLRARFAFAPTKGEIPDLWPRFASRLQTARPRQSLPRFWTLGSASTALAACAVLLWMQIGSLRPTLSVQPSPATAQMASPTSLVRMADGLSRQPLAESDTLMENIQSDQQERSLLLGSRGKE